MLKYSLLLFLGLATFCSSSSKSINSNSTGSTVENEEIGVYNSLGDYLRRVPGLQFTDGHYRIRGPQSLNNNTEPLYVLDGVIIGNSYSRASALIDPGQIARVNVLKSVNETSKYGMRGSNGVIEIFTKKD